MRAPFVSIVVPTYNRAHLICEAVDSILAQTHEDFEILLIDDGSTDNTREVLEAYQDPRLHMIHQENQGKSGARNRGLERAKGDYIAFLDSDDLWDTTFLATLLEVFVSEPEVDFAFCDFQRFDAVGTPYSRQSEFLPELSDLKTRPSASGAGKIFLKDPFLAFVPMSGFATWLQTVLIRASILEHIRFELGVPLGQDFRFMLRVWAASRSAAYVDHVLVWVRRHEDNSFFGSEHIYPTLDFLKKIRPEFTESSRRRVLDIKLGMQLRSIGYHHFSRGETSPAAIAYAHALRFRGGKVNSLKHLLFLPALPILRMTGLWSPLSESRD